MILVDDRIGSVHYAEHISNSVITRLDSADIAFDGNGITIGIEVKKIMDAVQCMYSGRLTDHQIPLMRKSYDRCYILIEGVYRACPKSGVLQYLRMFEEKGQGIQAGRWVDAASGIRRLMYSSFVSWTTTLGLIGGTVIVNSTSLESTVATIMALYSWYQRENHKSFKTMDETTESEVLTRPTILRRMIALLPRIGWDRSGILAKRFISVADMVNAPPEKWLIEKQIGMETASKIVAILNGE
jgi:ERCC4-type nuclease